MEIRRQPKGERWTMRTKQNLVIDLLFGRERFNKSSAEYQDQIEQMRLRPFKVIVEDVNDRLNDIWGSGRRLPFAKSCDFKAGDRAIFYREFPRKISKETIRSALIEYGYR